MERRVPPKSVSNVGPSYVRINIQATFHGFPADWLFVPVSPRQSDGWHQYSVGLRGKVVEVRDALSKQWGVTFVKGVPEGPDSAQGVAYYSDPPKQRPMLTASSDKSPRTVVTCVAIFAGAGK